VEVKIEKNKEGNVRETMKIQKEKQRNRKKGQNDEDYSPVDRDSM
jgi:hypothetical protein